MQARLSSTDLISKHVSHFKLKLEFKNYCVMKKLIVLFLLWLSECFYFILHAGPHHFMYFLCKPQVIIIITGETHFLKREWVYTHFPNILPAISYSLLLVRWWTWQNIAIQERIISFIPAIETIVTVTSCNSWRF